MTFPFPDNRDGTKHIKGVRGGNATRYFDLGEYRRLERVHKMVHSAKSICMNFMKYNRFGTASWRSFAAGPKKK